ncbi:TetR/AcrR family transcriptional regulator [Aliiroseovarius sp. S2029]|uniref:TetR/AcrR family transcriptional regulator n=1 Tax=Aliiroseovarius sp. S2029 TaxID=2936988 RepID=UPI0020BE524E|nr:TetR/AcrR family transcriptional regulator [Aliiroseovarius sp. S2029]MCK8484258.1 TetR/AcrR family transcriptional regulator [Aliiroseovarius sp. S2029]
MKDDTRAERQRQIELAAYQVLENKGFAGASMLAIAKQAKASNETLYRWYGDKTGLFSALVARNAADVKAMIERHLSAKTKPVEILERLAPALLDVLLGSKAIALNRAAAADSSGVLGQAILQSGRESIAPLIGATLERARADGVLSFDSTEEAVSLFVDLLVGDMQIRRAIGLVKAPSTADMENRAKVALARFQVLLAP